MLFGRRSFLAALASFVFVLSVPEASAADVRQESVREAGIIGEIHYPSGANRGTTIIMLGGSDGGTPSAKDAADLAASGYTVLALAYFKNGGGRPEGLPASLNSIPLEYFFGAIDWLKKRPEVNRRKIVLMGQSRGAEVALLLASLRSDIAGVIAFSPSSHVWHAVAAPGIPAWTIKGRPVRYRDSAVDQAHSPFETFTLAAPAPAARIAVEQIRGPVMLLSSRTTRCGRPRIMPTISPQAVSAGAGA